MKAFLLPGLFLQPRKKDLTELGHLQAGEQHCFRGSDISSLNFSKENELWKLHTAESTACPAVKEMSLIVMLEIKMTPQMRLKLLCNFY